MARALLAILMLGLGASAWWSSAVAETPPPAASGQDVIVTAPPIKAVPQLVQQFSQPFSGERLARWSVPLCPYVMGLTLDHDGYIAQRIGDIAHAAGLSIEPGNCEPNLVVVVSDNDEALRAAIGRHAQRLLSDGRFPTDKTQLRAFLADDGAPAHVFYVNGLGSTRIGGPLITAGAGTVSALGLSNLLFGAPVINGWGPSRLTPHVDVSLQRVLLVIDGRKAEGYTLAQLAAYAAVATFAEVRIDRALTGTPTITAMFVDKDAGRPPQNDLTFWDRAYLGALYNAPSQTSVSAQRSAISLRIQHAIQVLPAPPAVVEPAVSSGQPPAANP